MRAGILGKFALLSVLFLAGAPAFSHAAPAANIDANVGLYAGLSGLNGDWDFSFEDAFAGTNRKLDLTSPIVAGVQADFSLPGMRKSLPFNIAVAVLAANVSKNDFVTVPLPANNYYTTKKEVNLRLIEFDAGIKTYFGDKGDLLNPTLGAGGMLISASFSDEFTGVLKKLNTSTNQYDVVNSDQVKKDKSGILAGVWGSAGLVFRIRQTVNLGVEARYLYSFNSIDSGKTISGWGLGLTAGYHF